MKRVHLEPGIVGEHEVRRAPRVPFGLEARVRREDRAGFFDGGLIGECGEPKDLEAAIRLERMSLEDLQGLPLPSQ